ncbi:MAG: hypothetical protein JRD89_01055 [Deltaproteobacteria bacterium]|nr:hypothetical protein [Deltaproteobacteria bacterium]
MNRDTDTLAGVALHYTTLLLPILGVVYALLFTARPAGIYSTVPIPGGTTHKLTFILLCLSFLIYYSLMKYLYPLTRLVASLTMVTFQVHLYDFLWSLESLMYRGTLPNVFSFFFLIFCLYILHRIDNYHGVLNLTKMRQGVFFLLFSLSLLGFVRMAYTGFWDKMALVDAGITIPDPNQNIWWIVSKVPTIFLFLPYIDTRDIRAPLRLDPRVVTW